MTLEEKRDKIKHFCESRAGCVSPDKCPLYDTVETECYSDTDVIEKHYEILFGDKAEKTETVKDDPVNHPNHYTSGGIECIDAIAASMIPIEYAGFLKGQVLKYAWRYRLKGNLVQDLKKARFYLDRLIQVIENDEVS